MRIKKLNIAIYIGIFLTVFLSGKIINLAADYYWFNETGYSPFFAKSLYVRLGLGIVFALIAWAIFYSNLLVSRKFCRKPFIIINPDSGISSPSPIPYQAKHILSVLVSLSVVLIALFLGSWASGQWESALKCVTNVPFGVKDQIFNRDVSFYVFILPFCRFLFRFAVTTVIISFLTALAEYALNDRIYITDKGITLQQEAKNHLYVLAGIFCALLVFYFQFRMYDLLTLQRTLMPGAGYAAIHAYLPGLRILRFLSFISALSIIFSSARIKGKVVLGAAVLLVAGMLLTHAYAGIVQKFQVAPNEIDKETPYINYSINNTRAAYGLTGIQELEFDPQENLTAQALANNELTIKNIRLWEHGTLLTTFAQLQEIRTYYDFLDADNDRYFIDGEYRQVMLSVRELVPESLPSRIWINEHLTYTHGYGLCMGPVNMISPEGLPEFFIKDIPPSAGTNIKVTRPEIYYGETRADYAIVKTGSKEFDYPAGNDNAYTTYQGSGGVEIKNIWRRLLFSLYFNEIKIFFSSDITPASRILYNRSVLERLSKAAPFINFDSDPYIVIADDGRLFWMIDGYTVTDKYPYSAATGDINYVRNSVKATLDAYNGTIKLYIADNTDPIVRTYSKIFPEMFLPISQMPDDLRAHVRYPQALMNIQARIYSVYHMTDPQVFYNKEDIWKIPMRTSGERSTSMEPYYTITKLAEVGEKEEFILMVPFTPARKDNMIAWMAARCDHPNYGKLLVYNFPKQKLVYGPQQIESRIDQDPEISKLLTLWDQGGSRVIRGSLLVIPIEQSILNIQPLYLEASGGGLPELKRIIVAYGNAIAMEETLELSLMKIFSGKYAQPEKSTAEGKTVKSSEIKTIIHRIAEHFDKAKVKLKQGDWSGYGEEMQSAEKLLRQASELP